MVHMSACFSHIRPAFLPLLEDFIFANAQENIQVRRNLEGLKTLLGIKEAERERGIEEDGGMGGRGWEDGDGRTGIGGRGWGGRTVGGEGGKRGEIEIDFLIYNSYVLQHN